ncbi:A subunit of glutamyl-tRNA amidotransferase [Polychytrium aggregatum]|uniref:A subunit of glutamyl-tRNA amidotransferase n=1 Tax=Polychytrium aggregatum TaxID=110093 RepID=UPI0022FDE6C4|nr:A subunit of glutamyl-tRNA amidotransferase [Polychytrium aggregatum]KAI9203073.1 A subunit of glutamyl-tRNA amidotransferase [Polychytrium aggregatum]
MITAPSARRTSALWSRVASGSILRASHQASFADLSIAEASRRLKENLATPADLVESCLQRIREANPRINAVSQLVDHSALASAPSDASSRTSIPRSPLFGIPLLVKGNICVKGLDTTCSSAMLKGFRPPYDATVVDLLRNQGAVVMGHTNMDEFGMGSANIHSADGPVRNPRSLGRVPGGSSGGSAAAVASGMCFAALGSDTGGSVRLPAAYCGVVGFKPSYGRISRWGLVAYASSLDTIGILTRTVDDSLVVFDALAVHDPKDSTSLSFADPNIDVDFAGGSLQGLRIGVPQEYHVHGLDESILASWSRALDALAARGATIVPVSLPHTQHALASYYTIATAEASSNLSRYDGLRYGSTTNSGSADAPSAPPTGDVLYGDVRSHGFGAEVKRRIVLGTYILSAEAYDSYFLQAQKVRRLIQQDFDRVFARRHPLVDPAVVQTQGPSDTNPKVDVLLTPVSTTVAPEFSEFGPNKDLDPSTQLQECMNDILTVPASLAGLPALVIPYGSKDEAVPTPAGTVENEQIPIALQLIGQSGDDRLLFKIGKVLEDSRQSPTATK